VVEPGTVVPEARRAMPVDALDRRWRGAHPGSGARGCREWRAATAVQRASIRRYCTVAWITWDELAAAVRRAADLYACGDSSTVAAVRRTSAAIARAVTWHCWPCPSGWTG